VEVAAELAGVCYCPAGPDKEGGGRVGAGLGREWGAGDGLG